MLQKANDALDGIFHEGYISTCLGMLNTQTNLVIGGDKTGDDRWYQVNVPIADRLFDQHLVQLRREGAIDG